MAVLRPDDVHVEVELAAKSRGLPEFLDEGERKVHRDEEKLLVDRRLEDDVRPARKIHDGTRERLVERDEARPEPFDPGPRSARLLHRLPQPEAAAPHGGG